MTAAPRIGKEALPTLAAAKMQVKMVVAFIDVDRKPHVAWVTPEESKHAVDTLADAFQSRTAPIPTARIEAIADLALACADVDRALDGVLQVVGDLVEVAVL